MEFRKTAQTLATDEQGQLIYEALSNEDGVVLDHRGAIVMVAKPASGAVVFTSTESVLEVDAEVITIALASFELERVDMVSHARGGPIVVRVLRDLTDEDDPGSEDDAEAGEE